MQFQFQTTHYRKHYGDALFQIILLQDVPIGRLYVHYGPREIRLMDIALLAEHRGRGWGRSIIEDLMREAAHQEKTVTLHVERFNPALRLLSSEGIPGSWRDYHREDHDAVSSPGLGQESAIARSLQFKQFSVTST